MVAYEYAVAGQTFRGTRYSIPDRVFGAGEVKRVMALYPIGANIEIHYRRSAPGESAVVIGSYAALAAWDVAIMCSLVVSAGAWIMVIRRRVARHARRAS